MIEIQIPHWLDGDFRIENTGGELYDELPSLISLPADEEEKAIVSDLLFCLAGAEGYYVRYDGEYRISGEVHQTVRSFATKIIQLCNDLKIIRDFADGHFAFHHGRVQQATAAALQIIYSDFTTILGKLGTYKHLTLPLMVANLRSATDIFQVLASIIQGAGTKRGCPFLNELHQRISNNKGSQQQRKVCNFLFDKACVPLVEFIEEWINEGVIRDEYEEFFIESDESITPDVFQEEYESVYWDKKFIINDRQPKFIPDLILHEILLAGKTTAILRLCGLSIARRTRVKIDKLSSIRTAALGSSASLMNALRNTYRIEEVFDSLRRVMLFGRSDWIDTMFTIARQEMRKDSPFILSLDGALDVSLIHERADYFFTKLESEQVSDYIKRIHSVSVTNPTGIMGMSSHLEKWELFNLGIHMEWPLSLVFSNSIQIKYQLLFRTQLSWRRINNSLCNLHLQHRRLSLCAFIARQFVSNFLGFITLGVINPTWHSLQMTASSTMSIEDLFKVHEQSLDDALKGCFISDQKIFERVNLIKSALQQLVREIKKWQKSTVNSSAEEQEMLASSPYKYFRIFMDRVKGLAQNLSLLASKEGNELYALFLEMVGTDDLHASL